MVTLGVVWGSLMATVPREMTVPLTYLCQFLFARAQFQTQCYHGKQRLPEHKPSPPSPPASPRFMLLNFVRLNTHCCSITKDWKIGHFSARLLFDVFKRSK